MEIMVARWLVGSPWGLTYTGLQVTVSWHQDNNSDDNMSRKQLLGTWGHEERL
jgi:hypothetical protein